MSLLSDPVWAEPVLPTHWELYSPAPSHYRVERISEISRTGEGCASLASAMAANREHAVLLQKISAQGYLGRRLELTGYLRTSEVTGWAGLWVRVDGPDGEVLHFDNMMDRPVKGTTSWKRYHLTVDVPGDSQEVHFGALLSGRGQVWVDDLKLTARGVAAPGLEIKTRIRELPREARNLGFEK